VDVVGLSILSGAHLELFPRIVDELKKRDVSDVLLFCGGIIPEEDTDALTKLGFKAVFRPGTNTQDIVKFVYENVKK
jgi:methylmalonyl-CoA mutase C-terminal domain/subunit